MNQEGNRAVRAFVGVFLATMFLYVTFYTGCMAYRQRGGWWRITQDIHQNGTPILRIENHRLFGIGTNSVSLMFPGENAPARFTNAPYSREFKMFPNTNALPFGPVEFLDVTFLPGTVALDAFGHLVEMVPRTLFLDGQEIPWTPGTNIVVNPATKVPQEKRPVRKQK